MGAMKPGAGVDAARVLDFWFGAPGSPVHGKSRELWFKKDRAFDLEIKGAFEAALQSAALGAFDTWRETAAGALALCILFDQFPRNMYRGEARAFAYDAKAREVAAHAIACGFDRALLPIQRVFVYLPFEHSETLEDQRRSVALFADLKATAGFDSFFDYAVRHLEIVARFGRFPHRNATLGRAMRPEEKEFLNQPGSSF
jgi:uncharacterized protein (DUF924 family)